MNGRQDHEPDAPDRVDQAGFESFPASDPPSWTLGLEPEAQKSELTEVAASLLLPVTISE